MPILDHQPKKKNALTQSQLRWLVGDGLGEGAFQCERVPRNHDRWDLTVRRAA